MGWDLRWLPSIDTLLISSDDPSSTMSAPLLKKQKTQSGPKDTKKYIVDFSAPANDSVFDGDAYAQYMKEHIKVDGKAGNLGDKISVTKEGDGKLAISATGAFTKRFLKKNSMRDWLRVVANKQGFRLAYYNVNTA